MKAQDVRPGMRIMTPPSKPRCRVVEAVDRSRAGWVEIVTDCGTWFTEAGTEVEVVYVFDSPLLKCGENAYNHRQPFEAVCAKCGAKIYFDIDTSGTPGFNGEWGDGHGDWGCEVDNGDDSEDGNGHVPKDIKYNRHLYPRHEKP